MHNARTNIIPTPQTTASTHPYASEKLDRSFDSCEHPIISAKVEHIPKTNRVSRSEIAIGKTSKAIIIIPPTPKILFKYVTLLATVLSDSPRFPPTIGMTVLLTNRPALAVTLSATAVSVVCAASEESNNVIERPRKNPYIRLTVPSTLPDFKSVHITSQKPSIKRSANIGIALAAQSFSKTLRKQ
jgi:hypothetical protein